MSAAVASRQHNSSHTVSNSISTMGTNSPVDRKRNGLRSGADKSKTSSPLQAKQELSNSASQAKSNHPDQTQEASNAPATTLSPRRAPSQPTASDTPDYFNTVHNKFELEPNPFEQSFGNPSSADGKALLPPVNQITSPASLLPGSKGSAGFGWGLDSLRSGPLSPAMLQGPTGSAGGALAFDGHLRSGLTPNESGIRTGLTPGGSGSMFPAPSPNTQALFSQLASAGATPGTIDFHKTAISAAAARRGNMSNQDAGSLAQSQQDLSQANDGGDSMINAGNRALLDKAQSQQGNGNPTDPFGHGDANDAANGLFLLANATSDTPQDQSQFAIPGQGGMSAPMAQMSGQMARTGETQKASSNAAKRSSTNKARATSSISGSLRGISEMSDDVLDSEDGGSGKPNTRSRGKKGGNKKGQQNGRRKAEENPSGSKPPPTKKARASNSSDDGSEAPQDEGNENGNRKMTDEEKRKNFLERNRVAALKCRQRKKQWLANLQAKVEMYSTENDHLSAQVTALREEIVNLKTLLLAHKDCPVAQAQGGIGINMNQMANLGGDPTYGHPHGPYGMANGMGQPVMAGQGGVRRYS